MTALGLLVLLIIAGIAGALGQALAGYSLGGCLVSIVVGFVGAFLGMWIANGLGLPAVFVVTIQGEPFPLFWSIIGSAVLALVFGLLSRRSVAV